MRTDIPYHGQAAEDPNEIRRSRAKSGTVQADDTLIDVLQRLLARLNALEVVIPVIIRGKQGSTRALLQGRKSYRATYL